MKFKHVALFSTIIVISLIAFAIIVKYPVKFFNSPTQPELKPPKVNISNPISAVQTKVQGPVLPVVKETLSLPTKGIPVLMYHSISTISGNSLGVPVEQFKQEMEWLYRQNYHTLTLDEFYQAVAKKAPVPEKPILLTFDDGYTDNYSSAWPILQHYGYRATFFVVTSSVGHGMMNWEQLEELAEQGNSIGSHTVRHLDLATLSDKLQQSELTLSKQELQDRLGIKVQALCFPSGRYNATTLKLMPKIGYSLGFTTKPGKVHLGDNLLELKRIRISGGMQLDSFKKLFP